MWRNLHLRRLSPTLILALGCAGRGICPAQALPPSATTNSAPSRAAAPVALGSTLPAQERANIHPEVTLSAGLLTVTAQNSSLNQILREVSRATGMKISGTITEEKVFGRYGPASPQVVLTQLLEGTGTNILLHEDAQHTVSQLVLTPRQGAATPPDPAAASHRDSVNAEVAPLIEERRRRAGGGIPDPGQPGRQSNSFGSPSQPVPASQLPQPSSIDAQQPNAKTPQQIQQEQLIQQHLNPPPETP